MIRALSRSLSLRLLGIFIVTAILMMIVLIALFSRGMNSQWRRSIQPHLLQYVQYVQQDLGSPPDPERAELLAQKLPVAIHIYKGQEFIYSTHDFRLDLASYRFKSIPASQIANRSKHYNQKSNNSTTAPLNAAISMHNQPNGRILRIEQDGYSVYYDLHQQWRRGGLHGRYGNELLLALLALALVLGVSYYLIKRQLTPIGQIQNNVSRMANGELEHRINRSGHSDLDQLANSIDGMAARLQAMLDAKRQLLMAISHELRSPLTRARIATELLPESRNRERLEEDLLDMERMITDIMESERLQTNHATLNLKQLDIIALVQEELAVISPSTSLSYDREKTNPQQSPTYWDPVFVLGDATRLRILLRNLVTNALQHGNNDHGAEQVEVQLFTTRSTVKIKVSDQGAGITKNYISAVKEPFYRPDESRSRNTGGFGLGLTLANLIAKAHGGTLEIDSDPETRPGTRIIVTLTRMDTQKNNK